MGVSGHPYLSLPTIIASWHLADTELQVHGCSIKPAIASQGIGYTCTIDLRCSVIKHTQMVTIECGIDCR